MGKQHIIELNGKRYDALTGTIIPHNATSKQTAPTTTNTKSPVKSVDGVARRTPTAHKAPQPHTRPLEKSHTLMRKTVHKPATHKLHAVATIVAQKPTHAQGADKPVANSKSTVKNGLIRRFSPSIFKASDQDNPVHNNPPDPKAITSLSHVAVNAAPVVVSRLDQAIANATSHQQPKIKQPRLHRRVAGKLHVSSKIISVGASTLAIVLIAGFFGYQNIPNLRMRVASSRAGVRGTLPGYQPPGFRLDNISYKTGQINISFLSNSDKRNFTVTQSASSWNSDTLRDKLKSPNQAALPVEVPDKGKTLFIYNDSSVTWVDSGVLYKIEGDSKLNSQQLLRLADSI